PTDALSVVARLSIRLGVKRTMPIVKERSFGFDPSVFTAPAHCYLEGYWQSPHYFTSIAELIRTQFTVRDPMDAVNAALKDEMSKCNAVSVHVRRGDYVSNPTTSNYHGICSTDYYRAAERGLLERIADPVLFLFSDDPDWAESNLRFTSR